MSTNSALSAAKRRRGATPTQIPGPGMPNRPPQLTSCQISAQQQQQQQQQIRSQQQQQQQQQMNTPRPPMPVNIPPHIANNPQLLAQFQQMRQQQMQMQMQMQQQKAQAMPNNQPQSAAVNQRPIMPPGQPIPAALNKSSMPPNVPPSQNPISPNQSSNGKNLLKVSDLILGSNGIPCSPNGIQLPPIVLCSVYYHEIMNHTNELNDYSNRILNMNSRLEKIERIGGIPVQQNSTSQVVSNNDVNNGLATNTEFITSVVDNIINNTNLSDIINQIEPIQKEQMELRNMVHTQQTVINELSALVMKLLNEQNSMNSMNSMNPMNLSKFNDFVSIDSQEIENIRIHEEQQDTNNDSNSINVYDPSTYDNENENENNEQCEMYCNNSSECCNMNEGDCVNCNIESNNEEADSDEHVEE